MTESEERFHVKLYVVAPRYELVRIFAHSNHLHHDDVVYLASARDVMGRDYTGITVWVIGMPDPEHAMETRRYVENHGGRIAYAEPFEHVLKGM